MVVMVVLGVMIVFYIRVYSFKSLRKSINHERHSKNRTKPSNFSSINRHVKWTDYSERKRNNNFFSFIRLLFEYSVTQFKFFSCFYATTQCYRNLNSFNFGSFFSSRCHRLNVRLLFSSLPCRLLPS